jgi:hypothetical protein
MASSITSASSRCHIGLVGFIAISALLAKSASSVSVASLVHNGFVGFIGLGFVSLVGFISLFGYIGLVGCIRHNGLISVIGLSLFILISLSIHWPFKLATHKDAIKQTKVTEINKVVMMQAAHGVAMVSSASKITSATIWYYYFASLHYAHLFVRESWLWHVLSTLNSYFFGDALQNAKQLFSARLPQMTKYCVMRECDNFHSWISVSGDLVFSHQQGIYGFTFPKRFSWESLPEIALLLHLFC